VLGTDSDGPAVWLAAGQALQRVLLRARAAEVWSSFLNQPIEVAELRPRVAEVIGREGEYPQLLLRLGYGPSIQPQPRRAVEQVLVDDVRDPADVRTTPEPSAAFPPMH
jgi:hypothetical protein